MGLFPTYQSEHPHEQHQQPQGSHVLKGTS